MADSKMTRPEIPHLIGTKVDINALTDHAYMEALYVEYMDEECTVSLDELGTDAINRGSLPPVLEHIWKIARRIAGKGFSFDIFAKATICPEEF